MQPAVRNSVADSSAIVVSLELTLNMRADLLTTTGALLKSISIHN